MSNQGLCMQTTDKCELDLVVARALPEYVEDIHANFASEWQILPHELKKVGHILLRNILGMSLKKKKISGNVREKKEEARDWSWGPMQHPWCCSTCLTYNDPHMPLAVTEARFSLHWCKDMHYFHSAGNNFLEYSGHCFLVSWKYE